MESGRTGTPNAAVAAQSSAAPHGQEEGLASPLPPVSSPGQVGLGCRSIVVAAALFAAGILTLLGFQAILHVDRLGVSVAPDFLYQAQSFLQGRWDIDLPPTTTDVVVVGGKSYIVYPPLPALLLLPFVAVFG